MARLFSIVLVSLLLLLSVLATGCVLSNDGNPPTGFAVAPQKNQQLNNATIDISIAIEGRAG